MQRLWIAAVAMAAFLALPQMAAAGLRPRPSDGAPGNADAHVVPNALQVYNDYAVPERTYASLRAVVHYVVLGIDAPPLNDDDRGGVPDYVERVASAADTAIAYYERRGFAAVLADAGGPDARPDIYISRFVAGYFGVAVPAADARGGAFLVVSNALDPSPERSFGSLDGTVAHELFHLVQFSYFPETAEPAIPAWVLEGSAAAMEGRVYPELDDIVTSLQLRRWFAAPQRSLTTQSYGSQLFWRYLDERKPSVLPALLDRLAHEPGPAARALGEVYTRAAGSSFADEFARFAVWVAGERAEQITPLRTVAAGSRANGRVAPLAIHYVRLARSTRSVTLRAGGARVALVYQLESEYAGQAAVTLRLRSHEVHGARVYVVPAALRRNAHYKLPTLVIANGGAARVAAYSVATT